jgi:hypothetical protein
MEEGLTPIQRNEQVEVKIKQAPPQKEKHATCATFPNAGVPQQIHANI